MNEVRRPVLLNAYAAAQCPVRVQNDFNQTLPKIPWEPSPEDKARQEAGRAFEADVFATLLDLHASAVPVDPSLRRFDAIEATVEAMDSGAPLILGGWLPDDPHGGRTGRPDLLIRVEGGYLPADVKSHKTLKAAKTKTAMVSTLDRPAQRFDLAGWSSSEAKKRFRDGMQLAHYTRMLQVCGQHAGPLAGAILGTSDVALVSGGEPGLVLVWHALDEPLYDTFSRSAGKKKRSLLERYDHEHGFRLKVARTAARITGEADDPDLLVRPIGQDECARCPYQQWCADEMGPDDASAAITMGRLQIREWQALHRMGIETTADLSAVDADDPEFFDEYFPEVSNYSRDEARTRLAGAVRRARMICEGTEIVPIGNGIEVPSADIEIDFDVESDTAGRVYMWGVRVRRRGDDSTARYIADFVEWEPLDSHRERDLANRFVAWLRAQCAAAADNGQTIAVFHWTPYEIDRLRSILGLAEIGDLIDPDSGIFIDLHRWFKANFFSVHGAKLKTVAPIFGFSWRVDDPGGAVSQVYLSVAQTSDDPDAVAAAKAWLLSYNEDDTAATAAIRDGVRG